MRWLDALGADERLDEVAKDTLRLTGVRLVSGGFVALVVGAALGVSTAAWWFSALLAGEGLAWLTTRRFAGGAPACDRMRALFLLASLPISMVWTWLAFAFWLHPGADLRLAAVAVCVGGIVFAQNFRHQPISLLALAGGPPLACLVILPFLASPQHSLDHPANQWALLLVVATTINAMVLNRAAARRMDALTRGLRLEKERAQAASRAKSVFVATMSHEMRTPMNGLLGLAHALKATPLDARQSDHVALMLRSGETLMQLLNDVLDIARLDADDIALAPGDVDLHALVHAVADTWRDMAAAKALTLEVRIDPSTPQRLQADAARIRQVLTGLLSNALKFTRKGGLTIALTGQGGAPDGLETVAIRVSDTGPGVDPGLAERIFEPFTQADDTLARAHDGMGLGLTIARSLARRMGGDLSLEPASHGACFLFLVRAPLAQDRLAAEPGTALAPANDAAAPRVLMAEDNPTNQLVVRLMLEAAGVELTVVDDGRQALEALRAAPFDCVLMDINMPVMDGVTALAKIRAGAAGRCDTPVIALTASAMVGDRERFLRLGFDEHLGKPVKPADLISAIADAMDRSAPAAVAAG